MIRYVSKIIGAVLVVCCMHDAFAMKTKVFEPTFKKEIEPAQKEYASFSDTLNYPQYDFSIGKNGEKSFVWCKEITSLNERADEIKIIEINREAGSFSYLTDDESAKNFWQKNGQENIKQLFDVVSERVKTMKTTQATTFQSLPFIDIPADEESEIMRSMFLMTTGYLLQGLQLPFALFIQVLGTMIDIVTQGILAGLDLASCSKDNSANVLVSNVNKYSQLLSLGKKLHAFGELLEKMDFKNTKRLKAILKNKVLKLLKKRPMGTKAGRWFVKKLKKLIKFCIKMCKKANKEKKNKNEKKDKKPKEDKKEK